MEFFFICEPKWNSNKINPRINIPNQFGALSRINEISNQWIYFLRTQSQIRIKVRKIPLLPENFVYLLAFVSYLFLSSKTLENPKNTKICFFSFFRFEASENRKIQKYVYFFSFQSQKNPKNTKRLCFSSKFEENFRKSDGF